MFSTTYPQLINFFQLWVRKSGGGGIWGASCAAGTIQMWISYLSQLWSSHETNRNPIGSFSNDDSDGNENVKTEIGLLSKTTSLHVHHAFLYISLPLLYDYDVKMPKFTFCWGCKQATSKFSSSFKLERGPQEINSRKNRLHWTFSVNWNKRDKVWKTLIRFKSGRC